MRKVLELGGYWENKDRKHWSKNQKKSKRKGNKFETKTEEDFDKNLNEIETKIRKLKLEQITRIGTASQQIKPPIFKSGSEKWKKTEAAAKMHSWNKKTALLLALRVISKLDQKNYHADIDYWNGDIVTGPWR